MKQSESAEVAALYLTLSPRLERIVRLDVRAPDAVIEDACQFAWSRLIHHCERVRRDAVLSWLAKTATHEAFKLIRREAREASLDEVLERVGDGSLPAAAPGPADVLEQRERLAELRGLPERQQRLMWLQLLGLNYAEMARHEQCTERTVERQLLRAKAKMREAQEL